MTQTARPNGTTSNVGWGAVGAGTAHQALNDQSDSTFVSSNGGGDIAYGTLAALSDPAVSTGHVLAARCNIFNETGNTALALYQGNPGAGGTLIASQLLTEAGTIVDDPYTLSGAEADAITNYANLYWHISANGTIGPNVYEIWLDVPDGGGGGGAAASQAIVVGL